MIESFCFGTLVIDGKTYTSDLIIYPDGRIVDAWWRKSGHLLTIEDIDELIQSQPDVIVAGTGVHGYMKPDDHLNRLLNRKKITFIADKNELAIKQYNSLSQNKRVGACFHLTC
ncbi:MAG: hypothetical protein JRH18_06760 [Deltaproteobacteria bacterium]|nr:hypothetical protein [Deltaproteobacteria bacterium]MBW1993490.1 hypothetical protein [Deltaproteobacteria bacterium]MBW2151354.1 hypothetical protein [Deltaproteobacteria bacterium]